MNALTVVEPRKLNILAVLDQVRNGQAILPEFQRDFVWPRDQIEALIQSVLEGYYIGTFLTLDCDPKKPQFAYRLFAGVQERNPSVNKTSFSRSMLVLDGQQRLTALFYAFYEPAIPLKNAKHPFKFYLTLSDLVIGDVASSIKAVSVSNKREIAAYEDMRRASEAISFSDLLDNTTFTNWLYTKQNRWNKEDEVPRLNAYSLILQSQGLQFLSIQEATPIETIVNTFERLNKNGLALSVFDLATAHLFTKKIDLRAHWKKLEGSLPEEPRKNLIQAPSALKVTVMINGGDPRTGKLINGMPKNTQDFNRVWDKAQRGLVASWQRLTSRYGVLNSQFVPYKSMIAPLAAILGEFSGSHLGQADNTKIDIWYWISVFEQRYDNSADSKSVNDYNSVLKWIRDDQRPDFVQKFDISKLDLSDKDRTENNSLFKALKCLLILKGAEDIKSGMKIVSEDNEEDHLFPSSTEAKHSNVGNLLNVLLLTKETNASKSNMSPSAFLAQCLKEHDNNTLRLVTTLASQLITQDCYDALLQDDYRLFLDKRALAFKQEISNLIRIVPEGF